MYKIGQLAGKLSLSRSTLLYYDRIGLLSPSGRSEAGYRLYSEADLERLKSICAYREAGLSLEEIGQILDNLAPPARNRQNHPDPSATAAGAGENVADQSELFALCQNRQTALGRNVSRSRNE